MASEALQNDRVKGDDNKTMPLHGALAGAPITLAPSTRGMGPNTYLAGSHFWAMVCAAMIAHMAVFTLYALLPEQEVKAIPVRALSFKLGGQENIAAYGLEQALERAMPSEPEATTAPPPPMAKPAPPEQEKPAATTPPETAPPAQAPAQYAPLENDAPRQRPLENEQASAPPVPTPIETPVAQPAPAIAPTPQRYVRETGLPPLTPITQEQTGIIRQGTATGTMGGQGTQTILTPEAAQDIRTRYEQVISQWLEKHHIYPQEAGHATGRALVRVRVDRRGYVRYYAIERTSGNGYLDRAAIEMVRRANPMPAAPANYPAGNLIEFLIPIHFEAP